MKFHFPVIVIDEDFRSENASGLGIRALAKAIEEEGIEVIGVTTYNDLSQFAQQQSRASAFILSIDDEEFTPGPEIDQAVLNLRAFITEIRFRNADIPIYLYGETKTSRHIPNDILRELHGFIHMFEDTPEFVARHIIREARTYLDGLAPPFFRALTNYAQDGSYSWHCPGHSGGVAFLKSSVGQMFHQFFGENMLRADVCNAVDELGQLLDHSGPVAASERNAARIFSCDHLYFVTNGTSTSNKMVWHSTVAPGDVVIVDRNCHVSILHAITMTGAVPVFLMPTRNHFGIIGPSPLEEFRWENIEKKIKANPFGEVQRVQLRWRERIIEHRHFVQEPVKHPATAARALADQGHAVPGLADVFDSVCRRAKAIALTQVHRSLVRLNNHSHERPLISRHLQTRLELPGRIPIPDVAQLIS